MQRSTSSISRINRIARGNWDQQCEEKRFGWVSEDTPIQSKLSEMVIALMAAQTKPQYLPQFTTAIFYG